MDRETRLCTGFALPVTLQERSKSHVNYSDHPPGFTPGRRSAHLAVQLRLGILPERRPWLGDCRRACSCAAGPDLVQSQVNRRARDNHQPNEETDAVVQECGDEILRVSIGAVSG
jgi:hypothetical protein